VGIEVPNKVPAIVTLKEMLASNEFKQASNKSNLLIALGRNVAGEPVIIDLKKMPHMLVAGSTGTGKSICLHALLTSFLYQNSPAKMRLLLVDPKRVEFTMYNGIPHLLAPVVTDVDKTVNVLRWAVSEMERRFKLFSETGRRDIESYNQNPASPAGGPPEGKMPYIVIIIDELADLMSQAANEVEAAIVRLAQMARAVGIHLIVATQRPSVDVITGLIKANITTRIAFAVASQIDSRTIIDQSGAEKLLGKGDMLYIGADCPKPRRIQGAFIQEKEIKAVTEFIKRKGMAVYDESIINFRTNKKGVAGEIGDINDDLYEDAKALVIQNGKASASLLQRRMRIGYARAARILDLLEDEGIIGPAEGAKPRDILVDSTDSIPTHFPTFPSQDSGNQNSQNNQQY
jgi:S-DNA-T family DNA segregation ATPase FtsK/SpoIIIE